MIHIIMPVHNRLNLTKKCIESLDSQSYKNWTLYIVDDGSTDGTKSWINALSRENIICINGDGSLWWTGAMFKGVEYILNLAKPDHYIMSVNNDIVFYKDSLELLLMNLKKYPKSICSSISLSNSNGQIAMSSGAKILSWFFNITNHPFYGKSYNKIDIDNNVEVDMLTGRSVIYPLSVFNNNNFDYINFPHYGGDSEFTYRAKKRGYTLLIIPSSRVIVNRESTGLNPLDKKLSLKEMFKSLFSIRSTNNIVTKIKFAINVVPWYARPSYLIISILKIIIMLFIGNYYVNKNNHSQ